MPLSDEGKNKLIEGIRILGLEAPADAVENLQRYLEMIEDWNTRINLTRILGDDAVTLHFLDALSIVQKVPLSEVKSLADIGTGLGVPGLVLKIFFPKMRLLLVDSLKKRVTFLNAVIQDLGLTDAEAVHGRAEELGREAQYREKFPLVVARAVADLRILSELCIPLTEVGGRFVAYKGAFTQEELSGSRKAITDLGGQVVSADPAPVPFLEAERTLIVIAKQKPTRGEFPRPYRLIERP